MKWAHNLKVRVFVQENEDYDRIKSRLKGLFPIDFEKEKIKVQETVATGFEEKKITILKVKLEKHRNIRAVLEKILSNLTEEQKQLILRQLDSRVGEDGRFFIRLDKEKLLDDEYWITNSGDCFHVSVLVAAYPMKKEKAKKVVEDIILGNY